MSEQRSPLWHSILFSIVGCLLALVAIGAIHSIISHGPLLPRNVIAIGLISVFSLPAISLILYPFRDLGKARFLRKLSVIPIVMFSFILRNVFAAPAIAVASVILIPMYAWSLLVSDQLVVPPMDRVVLYLVLVLSSFLLSNFTDQIVRLGLVTWRSTVGSGYSESGQLARASTIRVFTYGLMLLAYVMANIERFGHVSLVHWEFWLDYKSVLLEVLLTYVALDSLKVAWQDHLDSVSSAS
jgi:hypothetical protein